MGEFEEKLNSILSSPKDMEKIMNLAQSLSSSLGGSSDKEADKSGESRPASDGGGALSGLLSGDDSSGGIDPRMIQIMSRIMSAYSSNEGTEKFGIMSSIKPYLRPERQETVDRALNILKLTKIAKIAFGEFRGDLHL